MALITRCPVCGTLFRVVPDQLRISEGWVRCGQCAEIFDASGDLQPSDVEHQHVQSLDDSQVPVFVPAPVFPAPSPPVISEDVGVSHPTPEPEWVPIAEPVWQVPVVEPPPHIAVYLTEHAESVEPLPLAEPVAPPEVVPAVVEPVLVGGGDAPAAAVEAAPSPPPAPAPGPDLPLPTVVEEYSFSRAPVAAVAVRNVWVHAVWGGAACVLLLLLGLQAAVAGRDRLAATWPEAKPVLQSLCIPLGCSVQAWRNIESVVIDSSTLAAMQNGDVYRLSVVLKNLAMVDLAMPSVEFVLTDIDEQAVFRRVLTPTELGAASRVLFAGREWATALDVKVVDGPGKDRIVGYRLLAFYP